LDLELEDKCTSYRGENDVQSGDKLTAANGRKMKNVDATWYCVKFEVFTAVNMKNAVFWDVT
jgi:hypothetical protein